MTHAFVSYVREDAAVIDYIVRVLRANGVRVWVDRDNIEPGQRWKSAIRSGIRDGARFIAMFSSSWERRERTFANEELIIAIEELRQRPADRAWFIPVKLDACEIPDRDIGAGETLRDFQHINFPELGWLAALKALLRSVGVPHPMLEQGEPLGSGLPPNAKIEDGQIVIDRIDPPTPVMHGLIYSITGGWIARTKANQMLAYLSTRAPSVQLQRANEQLGLHSFYAASNDAYISSDRGRPNEFAYATRHEMPANSKVWDPNTLADIILPIPVLMRTHFEAKGYLERLVFRGAYSAGGVFEHQLGRTGCVMIGSFEMRVRPEYDPDPAIAPADFPPA